MKTAHIAQTVSRGIKASEGNQTETNFEVCEKEKPVEQLRFPSVSHQFYHSIKYGVLQCVLW